MQVELRKITPKNFAKCIKLEVGEDQKAFVAPNVMSIAQSSVYPTMSVRGVYARDELVGFVMYGLDPDDQRHYLVRLMIDLEHQGKGYGRSATLKVIEELRKIEACDAVYLSYVPENKAAETLYESVGFEKTGETDDESGEIVMRYSF